MNRIDDDERRARVRQATDAHLRTHAGMTRSTTPARGDSWTEAERSAAAGGMPEYGNSRNGR